MVLVTSVIAFCCCLDQGEDSWEGDLFGKRGDLGSQKGKVIHQCGHCLDIAAIIANGQCGHCIFQPIKANGQCGHFVIVIIVVVVVIFKTVEACL